MTAYQFDHYLNQIHHFVQAGGWVAVTIALVCGLALAYAGLKVYWIGLFLSGMFFGGMLGAGAGAAAGASDAGLVAVIVISACIGGGIAVAAVSIAVVLLGMFAGGLLAVAGGVSEPWVIFLVACVCGGVAAALHQFAIICSTAVSGAVLLTWSVLNATALIDHGSMAYLSPSPVSYGLRLGKSAWNSNSLEGVLQTASGDLLLFLFFLITGIAFQLNFDRLVASLFKRGIRKSVSLPQTEVSSSPVISQQPEKRPGTPDKIWQVTLFEEGEMTSQHELMTGEYMIGRNADCDLVLNDPAVSAKHLQLRVSDSNQLMLKDMDSANGTWRLGEKRVGLEQPQDGDWYQMGKAQVLVKKLSVQ